MNLQIRPGGSWSSPISAADAGAGAVALGFVTCHEGRLYWIEGRPRDQGRNVLVAEGPASASSDGPIDITPATVNVRTRVHEYGGLAYALVGTDIVFSNDADQRLYLQRANELPIALTPPGYRYADGHAFGQTLYCVREDHSGPGEARNTLVALPITGEASAGQVLFDDADFVAYPRVSQDGHRIAFISWKHPDMPFDATRLHVADLDAQGRHSLRNLRTVAGTDGAEAVQQPQWDGDDLYFLSDRDGYWNLYRLRAGVIAAVTRFDADLGGALWQLGMSTYALTGDGRAVASVCRAAVEQLVVIDLASGAARALDLPFCAFSSIGLVDANTAFAVAASAQDRPCIVRIDLRTASFRVVRRAGTQPSPAYVSVPQPIEFATQAAPDGSPRTAHAFLYPPRNPDFQADGPTPLLVLLHGGPTSHAAPVFRMDVQFWTSRGFAVALVNYGGSTGYGRAYRERLRGQWGVVDLQDAVAAVDHLVARGTVAADRVAIRGGSAGGFTVLLALAFTDRFNAGINYYGVADALALAADTHKFESRYTDRLIAPLPEGIDTYRARSALAHLERFRTPLITFQGAEDRVVPPEQSRAIVAALRERGVPVAYLEFASEQHGFRDARNIARALEAELYFLGRVFGFTPADAVEPVPIDNLSSAACKTAVHPAA